MSLDKREQPLARSAPLPGIGDDEIAAWLGREFFHQAIDAETCAAKWYAGERMNWDLAIVNLFV